MIIDFYGLGVKSNKYYLHDNKVSLLFLIEFTTTISICTGGLEIAAILQAFGFSVGSCGLANVLQCVMDKRKKWKRFCKCSKNGT